MANFQTYPGLRLKSLIDRCPYIKAGDILTLLNTPKGMGARNCFTFLEVPGQYVATGKDYEPLEDYYEWDKEIKNG